MEGPRRVADGDRPPSRVIPIPQDVRRQLETLRQFNRKVDHLDRSGFAARYADEIPNVVAKFENVTFEDLGGGEFAIQGRIESWLQDFNQDEIDAFVLTYRLFTQNNDPISIASLARIYSNDWMPAEGRAYFDEARAGINDYLSRAATVMLGEDLIAIGAIVDIVIYGGMAHTNPRKTAIFEAWMSSGIAGFIWAEFFAYARFMLEQLRYIRSLNASLLNAIDDGQAQFVQVLDQLTLPDA